MCYKKRGEKFAPLSRVPGLESETKSKLHNPRAGQRLRKPAQCGLRGNGPIVEGHRSYIKASGVSDIENFPVKGQVLRLAHFPLLTQAGIDSKVSGTSELVSLA